MIPYEATHPTELIQEELQARKDLTKIQVYYLNQLIKDKTDIKIYHAIVLEEMLGIQVDFWINLQKQYEIDSRLIKIKRQEKQDLTDYFYLHHNLTLTDTQIQEIINLIIK